MEELVPEEIIEQNIFLLRGQKVMLSAHLAKLYGVKRNIERFPEDFMFPLTRGEIMNLSQFVISSRLRHAPNVYAFTEQGVAMLSSVLRSKRAIQVNIAVMRAFVKLRQILSTHKELAQKLRELEYKIGEHDQAIQGIFEAIRQLTTPPPEKPKARIGFHRD
jgi:hypothetical protein